LKSSTTPTERRGPGLTTRPSAMHPPRSPRERLRGGPRARARVLILLRAVATHFAAGWWQLALGTPRIHCTSHFDASLGGCKRHSYMRCPRASAASVSIYIVRRSSSISIYGMHRVRMPWHASCLIIQLSDRISSRLLPSIPNVASNVSTCMSSGSFSAGVRPTRKFASSTASRSASVCSSCRVFLIMLIF